MVYDGLSRQSSRDHAVNGTELYKVDLTYDSADRITSKIERVGGVSHTYDYTYDPDGQLTKVTKDGMAVEEYFYDVNGNRASRRLGGGSLETAVYDTQDRITKRGSTEYAIDNDGFLSGKGADSFEYSARGELLEATVGTNTIRYSYDGMGRRVGRTDSLGTYQYSYGNPENILRVTAAVNETGVASAYYYDEKGALYALDRGGVMYYVASDQVGTPLLVTNSAGLEMKRMEYDSFGNMTFDSNSSFDLPIGFAGGLADGATRLLRFGFRDYEPAAGRWTARDPILFGGAQANLFSYVHNDPVNLNDPSGLIVFETGIGGSFFAGIGFSGDFTFTRDTNGNMGFKSCRLVGAGAGGGLSVKGAGISDGYLKPGFNSSFGLKSSVSTVVGVGATADAFIGWETNFKNFFTDPCSGREQSGTSFSASIDDGGEISASVGVEGCVSYIW